MVFSESEHSVWFDFSLILDNAVIRERRIGKGLRHGVAREARPKMMVWLPSNAEKGFLPIKLILFFFKFMFSVHSWGLSLIVGIGMLRRFKRRQPRRRGSRRPEAMPEVKAPRNSISMLNGDFRCFTVKGWIWCRRLILNEYEYVFSLRFSACWLTFWSGKIGLWRIVSCTMCYISISISVISDDYNSLVFLLLWLGYRYLLYFILGKRRRWSLLVLIVSELRDFM